jgi:hypothetical protein
MKEKSKKSDSTILETWKKDYQSYIDDYIEKQKKPIIFVGLNTDLGSLGFRNKKLTPPKAFYNVHADHKYYIDLPINQILEQKFNRQIMKICNNKEKWFKKWLESPEKTQDKLNYDININYGKKKQKNGINYINQKNIYLQQKIIFLKMYVK